ncbi:MULTISPECIES: DUF6879 family protein [Streptomyces]|uniref:DUF6879 domain-containing protein n=1 Tax=Streptomyces luteosporeus TaxID=173856 RepID=A0ABN3TP42_9ACTN
MADVLPFSEITYLFKEFEHTAWRLETRREYASDRNGDNWKRWQAGERLGFDPRHPWHANVRAQVEAGKRFQRVRIVDDPPTEGQRFLLATARSNITAGEDIRVLPRAEAERLGLPDFDFWLFDSRILARFHFSDDGTTLGVELTEEPSDVLRACQVRDVAWHRGFPADDLAWLM